MTHMLKKFVHQWMDKACEDLLVVEKLTEGNIIASNAACFHCQQAVEKFLKAFLIANGQDIIKTHNIEFLLSECKELDDAFSSIDPKNLSDYGVDVRYPGDMYVPDNEEVISSKAIALQVKNLVMSRIAFD
jgi:HEPN domain-containing protein